MSIFAKPLSQITPADLQELLSDQAVENIRLEFKSQVPSKDDTLKKLSSFANTYGGFLVVGATENGKDGRIQNLPGVDEEAGYKQKIVQWCFDGSSPPLVVEVSDAIPSPTGQGKVCYVVRVDESDVAPHFLNGRKGLWIRTDEFSARFEARLADDNEFRHLLDRRRLIRDRRTSLLERARQRFRTYISRKYTDRAGNLTGLGSLFEFCIVPRFPALQLYQQEMLKDSVQTNWTRWRGVIFPDQGSPILSQHESAIVLNAARGSSIFESNVWGMLFYATKIDDNESGTLGIHLGRFVGYVVLFVIHAGKMLKSAGYNGPLHVRIDLRSIRGVPWLYALARGAFGIHKATGSELDDDFGFSLATTSELLFEKPDGIVMEVLRHVLFSAGLADLTETPSKLESLVRLGYEYNSWGRPENLKA
jgi:hypothetical protein